jgi:hypothetical protein
VIDGRVPGTRAPGKLDARYAGGRSYTVLVWPTKLLHGVDAAGVTLDDAHCTLVKLFGAQVDVSSTGTVCVLFILACWR